MNLSANNQKVIDVLRENYLFHLILPFKKMIELNDLGEIKVHKMTWKVIMRDVYNENISRKELEKIFLSYFVTFGIIVPPKKRIDARVSKERVKKHREDKRSLGYKTVSIQLSPKVYEKFKKKSNDLGLSYADLIEKLL